MANLRARLAELVGAHYPCPCGKNELGYPHCVCGWTEPVEGTLWRDHLADVLLSLPDVVIADREALVQVITGGIQSYAETYGLQQLNDDAESITSYIFTNTLLAAATAEAK